MFCGACAGSTGGGFKVSRVMLLAKSVKRELNRLIHPRSRTAVTLEGKTIDDATVNGVGCYLALYVACLIAVFILLCFDSAFDIEQQLFGGRFLL